LNAAYRRLLLLIKNRNYSSVSSSGCIRDPAQIAKSTPPLWSITHRKPLTMNADLNTECYANPAGSRLLLSIIGCDEYDGAMLKPIRLYAAVGLALTAIAIPAVLTFADQKLTDTIRQA
jgi:hypothetical protein